MTGKRATRKTVQTKAKKVEEPVVVEEEEVHEEEAPEEVLEEQAEEATEELAEEEYAEGNGVEETEEVAEEQMEAEEGGEAEEVEAEAEAEVEAEAEAVEGEEEKKEEEKKDDKPKRVWFQPSRTEFIDDTIKLHNCKVLAVGPLKLADWENPILLKCADEAAQFSVNYKKTEEGEHVGHMMLTFDSEETALEKLTWLVENLPDHIISKHLRPVENKPVNLDDIKKGSQPLTKAEIERRADRSVAVILIPPNTTEEDIQAKYENAISTRIPVSFATGKPLGFCYVEFATKEEVDKVKSVSIKLGDPELTCSVKTLENMPPVGQVVEEINQYKDALKKDGAFDYQDELTSLHRLGIHYERCDYLNEQEKKALSEAMELLRSRYNRDKRPNRGGFKRPYEGGGGYGFQPKRGRDDYGGYRGGYGGDRYSDYGPRRDYRDDYRAPYGGFRGRPAPYYRGRYDRY